MLYLTLILVIIVKYVVITTIYCYKHLVVFFVITIILRFDFCKFIDIYCLFRFTFSYPGNYCLKDLGTKLDNSITENYGTQEN